MAEQVDLFAPAGPPAATFSPCGTYRYTLRRRWAPGPVLHWVLLNPSTADATRDDPTIRRCIGFSKREGYSGLVLLNLFALRSTDPRGLREVPDPVGPGNDAELAAMFQEAVIAVMAWGAYSAPERVAAVVEMARGCSLHCLGTTKDGSPRHPLYLSAETPLQRWYGP